MNELKRKAEVQAEAELWAEVAQARYGAKWGTEPKPKIEALATESGEPDCLFDIMKDLDSNL